MNMKKDAFSCSGRCDGPEPHGLLRSEWRLILPRTPPRPVAASPAANPEQRDP